MEDKICEHLATIEKLKQLSGQCIATLHTVRLLLRLLGYNLFTHLHIHTCSR
jgi:hypothetical protein